MQDPSAAFLQPSAVNPQFPDQERLKCPRCDSPNTKFCYYNNYNLSQPRHFCKNCRRYWTKGGALRNIPVGGGTRKTNSKRPTSSSSSKPRPSPPGPVEESDHLLKPQGSAQAQSPGLPEPPPQLQAHSPAGPSRPAQTTTVHPSSGFLGSSLGIDPERRRLLDVDGSFSSFLLASNSQFLEANNSRLLRTVQFGGVGLGLGLGLGMSLVEPSGGSGLEQGGLKVQGSCEAAECDYLRLNNGNGNGNGGGSSSSSRGGVEQLGEWQWMA